MLNLGENTEVVKKMRNNDFEYFIEKCSVENMTSGFVNAIND